MAEKAILFDATRCIACRACQVACKQWNGLSGESTRNLGTYENPPDLSAQTWVKMRFVELTEGDAPAWTFVRQACMHCTDAACVRVCPTKALAHHELGMVTYDPSECSGCGYCVDFCPFHTPRAGRNLVSGMGKMAKCTMCTSPGLDRIGAGYQPACVKTCPTGALSFADRADLVAEGTARVQALRAQGRANASLYGENELDGLHVLYVLNDSPEAFGLPANPRVPATAMAWKGALQPVGWALGGLAIVGLALNFVIARRAKFSQEAAAKRRK